MFYNLINFNFLYLFLVFIYSFFVCFFLVKILIKYFHTIESYQPIRQANLANNEMAPDHAKKQKTPTMGGLAMFAGVLLSVILFCDIKSYYVISFLIILISFAFFGFLDDYEKVFKKNTKGFQGSKKLILELIFSSVAIFLLCCNNINYLETFVFIPFFNFNLPLGNFILAFYMLIISGSGNATNFTDGLDGLLSGIVITTCLGFLGIIFLMNKGYLLNLTYIDTHLLNNIIIILCSIIAVFSSFLIFNYHPAKIFMGDVGSLFIGSILSFISILLKIEFFYAIMILVMIWEMTTVILQVCYFRTTGGKRLFKISPYHSHLEKSGWSEKKIVFSFWFVSLICSLFSVIIYYLITKK